MKRWSLDARSEGQPGYSLSARGEIAACSWTNTGALPKEVGGWNSRDDTGSEGQPGYSLLEE